MQIQGHVCGIDGNKKQIQMHNRGQHLFQERDGCAFACKSVRGEPVIAISKQKRKAVGKRVERRMGSRTRAYKQKKRAKIKWE